MEYPRQTIFGNTPSKSNCYIIIKIGNHGSLAKTPQMKAYEDRFYFQCKGEYRDLMIDRPFIFYLDVYFPSMRSDLDNSQKVVLDVLQRKVKAIKNDNLASEIHARKFIDKENPRIEFYIKTV